ncbi:MAG: T9SS type A sorting domain-containing protein [Flavobacteriales bacterium]
MIKAERYISEHDQLVTNAGFEALEDSINLTPAMQEEYVQFGKWLDINLENENLMQLSNADKTNLRDIALDYYYTTAGKKAAAILNTYCGEDHFIPPYYQGAPGEVRAFLETLKTTHSIQFIEAFPNPANDYLTIKVHLEGVIIKDEAIKVFDSLGKPLQTLKVTDPNQQFALDLRSYASGNYSVSLCAGEKLLQTIAFNVVH